MTTTNETAARAAGTNEDDERKRSSGDNYKLFLARRPGVPGGVACTNTRSFRAEPETTEASHEQEREIP